MAHLYSGAYKSKGKLGGSLRPVHWDLTNISQRRIKLFIWNKEECVKVLVCYIREILSWSIFFWIWELIIQFIDKVTQLKTGGHFSQNFSGCFYLHTPSPLNLPLFIFFVFLLTSSFSFIISSSNMLKLNTDECLNRD